MDRNKQIILGGAVLITGIAGYFFFKNKKKKKLLMQNNVNQPYQSTNGQNINNQVTVYKPPVTVKSEFPLQIGSRGENVKKLQSFLNQKINAGLVVDGVFGSKTAEAVKKAIGSTQVSESTFKQYIGAPLISAGAGISAGNPAGNFSLNPFANIANAATQALSFFKPKN
jgi:peptidoglycan hydrolase-like protein with peptidoglycan-binding domain